MNIILKKRREKADSVKEYLRKKFEDGTWRAEAEEMEIEPKQSVYDYLAAVRNFIEAQEEYQAGGIMLYSLNSLRAEAHEEMLDDYKTDDRETNDLIIDVSKSFDFVGDLDPMTATTKFCSECVAALKLAYAISIAGKELFEKGKQ